MFLILYSSLSHIYHTVLLVIIFEYLVIFILLVILFQNFDSISENSFIFKIHSTNNNPLCTDLKLFWNCK